MKKTILLFLLLCLPTLASARARRSIEAQNRVRHQPRLIHKSRPCHPTNYVDPKIQGNLNAAVRDMKRAGIRPKITSAWRSSHQQSFLYKCSRNRKCRVRNPGIYYAKAPGTSLHEAGFAVDIDGVASGKRGAKRVTPRGRKIVGIMQKHGFNWRYGLKDPPHFEADPRRHGYRTVAQAVKKTQTTCQNTLAKNRAR